MNKRTESSADLKIYTYRNESTFVFVTESQTHGLAKHFSHCSFCSPEGLRRLQKKFSRQSEEKSYGI